MPAVRKQRRHLWHASYAVLAFLASLLIAGCDNPQPAAAHAPGPAQAMDSAPVDADTTPAGEIEPIEPPASAQQEPAS